MVPIGVRKVDKPFAYPVSKSLFTVQVNPYSMHGMFLKKVHLTFLRLKKNDITSWTGSDDVPWLKLRRSATKYENPCQSTTSIVNTIDLDNGMPTGTKYYPPTLIEKKCTGAGSLHPTGKYQCKKFVSGDCIDITTDIMVQKVLTSGQVVSYQVELKVGCACFIRV